MLRSLLLYLSECETPRRFLTTHSLGRRVARRFIAGEALEDAIRVVRRLNAEGMDATLDHLGESVQEPSAAEDACRTYLAILDRLASERLRSHISIKLTQLGLAFDEGLTQRLLTHICERAAQHRCFVRIDMESSLYIDRAIRVFQTANAPRDVLGIVIQAYLYRSEKDVKDLLGSRARIRLVKGAYKEPADISFRRRSEVDQNFRKLMEMMLGSGIYHAIATHDDRLISAAQTFAASHKIGPGLFEFQFLYGIRRQLQRNLVKRGYRVRIYVPYGTQWYPYFMRRLAERPANLLFLLRNIPRA